MGLRPLAVVVLLGCSFEPSNVAGGGGDAGRAADAPPSPDGVSPSDAALPDAPEAPLGPFGGPTLVAELSLDTARDDDPTLTADMLEIYFESDRESATAGVGDIFVSRRDDISATWSLPDRVDELSTSAHETSVEIAPDGLTIYFSREGGDIDIFRATRLDRADPWSTPTIVSELSSSADDYDATLTLDQLTVLFGSNRSPARGGMDVFRASRPTVGDPWEMVEAVAGLDTDAYESEPFEDASGVIWFTGNLAGTQGPIDLWRSSLGGPERVSELNSDASDSDAWLSPDRRTIYFTSTRRGSYDIFRATR